MKSPGLFITLTVTVLVLSGVCLVLNYQLIQLRYALHESNAILCSRLDPIDLMDRPLYREHCSPAKRRVSA